MLISEMGTEAKFRQFHHEMDGWKRSLEFMMEENARQKNRLGEVLQNLLEKGGLLEAAEGYQSNFLSEDETICLLRRDISAMEKLLSKEMAGNDGPGHNFFARKNKLAAEIRNFIGEFSKLNFEFNNYLGDVL